MAGVNESGKYGGASNEVIAAVAEDFIALRLSESPTGQIQLNENLSGTTLVMLQALFMLCLRC